MGRGLEIVSDQSVAPAPSGWLRALAAPLAAPQAALAHALEMERARWFVWLPVLFGSGIAIFFALPAESGLGPGLALPAAAAILKVVWRRDLAAAVVSGALLAVAAGFAVATVRAHAVAHPVLAHRMQSVTVEGLVELVEPKLPRGQRLTLRVLALGDLEAGVRPARVRVRVMVPLEGLRPGEAVRLRATLSPPSAPSLPGDYDFARTAWFSGIGAVGFALRPPERIAHSGPQPTGLRARAAIEEARLAITRRIVTAVPGEHGAIASALITGERGQIAEATNQAFRDSGLFHVLSISGLHMVVMAGAVFWFFRASLALIPQVALRFPIKKWSAAAAAVAAFGYLMISGGSVATIRAFLMILIMLVAIMLDRPALAMRNVAISALLVLVLTPESLLDAGFQMSFAAVASLIAVYERVRGERDEEDLARGPLHRLAFFFGGIVLTTVVAGLAVWPFAAYHFHKSQQFAVLANLAAIPVCNIVVMPAGLATLLAMPFGLEAVPLWVMDKGIGVMLWAAKTVAAMPGAVGHIPAMPGRAFGFMVAGGLWLVLWQRRWRLLGLAGIALGFALVPGLRPPDLLVSREGTLLGVRGADGALAARAVRSSRFELGRWLEHEGDARPPAEVLKADGLRCDGAGCTGMLKGLRVSLSSHPAGLQDDCRHADVLVIAGADRPAVCPRPRLVIDQAALRASGAHAVYVDRDGVLKVETVAGVRGARLWAPVIEAGTGPGAKARAARHRAHAPDRDGQRSRGVQPKRDGTRGDADSRAAASGAIGSDASDPAADPAEEAFSSGE